MGRWITPAKTAHQGEPAHKPLPQNATVGGDHHVLTEPQAMPRSQRNDNFIDKTFTVMADMILKMMPAKHNEKQAFAYYRDGMSAQADGEYAEALDNYQEALTLEEDPYDRSFILYNIGLIHASNGEHDEAMDYYQQALDLNPRLCQALNNIAVIYHYKGEKVEATGDLEGAAELFDEAAKYWIEAINIAPNNYIEAQNWLKNTGRLKADVFF
jgi:tetratricopeptide (TPR) repeat protein